MNEHKTNEIPGMYEGPVKPLIIKMAAPIFAGMIVQVLYNVTDTFWVSRIDLSDPSYMGGTAIVFPLLFFFMALGNGIMVGVSSLVARAIGERNSQILSNTAESGLFISFVLSVLSMAILLPLAPAIISALGAEGDYYTHSLEYLKFIIPAGPVMFFTYVFQGILQGEGMMKYVMNAMLIGTILNITLDPVFIFILDMNIRGAAIATVLAQAVALVYSISVFVRKKSSVHIKWAVSNIKPKTMEEILVVGIPQAVAQIIMSFSFFIFNRIVISIDQLAITSFALCGRFEQIMLMPAFAIGAAIVTIAGQNAGRDNFARVRLVVHESWKLGLVSVGVLTAFMVGFAPWVFRPFTDVPEVLNYAVTQYRILGASYLCALIGITGRSFFQAIGFPVPALLLTLLRLVIIAIPVMSLLVYVFDFGMYGVWAGIATGSVITMFITLGWVKRTLDRLESGKLKIRRV